MASLKITEEYITNNINVLEVYVKKCIEVAKENWCPSHVNMLEDLFEAVILGYDYKCIKCEYFQKIDVATEKKDCIWQPNEENGFNIPCEMEEE